MLLTDHETAVLPPPRPATNPPLRVMFILTSAGIGGSEMLTFNLIRRLDRSRFAPELCCLKTLGPLGEILSREIPTHERLLAGKYDLRVLPRLVWLLRKRRADVVITVGAGDKMFWGRLAAAAAGVRVVLSAIHSTGWPDEIGRLNRLLTPLTDVFIGVAEEHGRHLCETEGFAAERVRVIPNGVDTERFAPGRPEPGLRRRLGIPAGPVAGIVARLNPEKNVEMFLEVAAGARREVPSAQFVIVGDGPRREALEARCRAMGLSEAVHFLGYRCDTPALYRLFDAFVLTSHNEASPVSILESLASGVPVVATRVGSVPEIVEDGAGFVVERGDVPGMTRRLVDLLQDRDKARAMGQAGRELVTRHWGLDQMVRRYEELIEEVVEGKRVSAR